MDMSLVAEIVSAWDKLGVARAPCSVSLTFEHVVDRNLYPGHKAIQVIIVYLSYGFPDTSVSISPQGRMNRWEEVVSHPTFFRLKPNTDNAH